MSSDYVHKSICKTIYTEEGFSGIITSLSMFPERLHDEILEEISMNMIEWENKLRVEEKEDIERNLSKYAESVSIIRNETLDSLKNSLCILSVEEKKIEEKRENIIKNIEEFPSFYPETDIDNIAIVDEELDTIKKRILNTRETIDDIHVDENKKTERRDDSLFQ